MLLSLLGKRGGDGILGDVEAVRANQLGRLREDVCNRRSGVDELYAGGFLGSNCAKAW